jgi:hypothetical protein
MGVGPISYDLVVYNANRASANFLHEIEICVSKLIIFNFVYKQQLFDFDHQHCLLFTSLNLNSEVRLQKLHMFTAILCLVS